MEGLGACATSAPVVYPNAGVASTRVGLDTEQCRRQATEAVGLTKRYLAKHGVELIGAKVKLATARRERTVKRGGARGAGSRPLRPK